MEDNVSAEKTLRSRLENMDPAQLAAVSIEILPSGVSLVPPLKKKKIKKKTVAQTFPFPLIKKISLAPLK